MSNLICQICEHTFSNLGNLNKHRATNKKCNPDSTPNNGIGGMMNLLLEIKSIVSNKEENNMIRLLKEEIRMMKEKEKDEIKGLKKEIELLKEKEKDEIKGLKKEIELLKEAHSIEIKMLKAKFQEKKEEEKEKEEEKKEVVKKVKVKDILEKRADGFEHIGGVGKDRLKKMKDYYLKTGKFGPPSGFIKTPENMNRLRLYVGLPVKPIEEEEEKKEEPQPQPQPEPKEEEEEEEETDDDKEFGEYCDKNQYGYYEIGGMQSETLRTLKKFCIPDDLLYGERKTKCVDKMDYLKREFSGVFLNFSGTKANFEKLKFYLEN